MKSVVIRPLGLSASLSVSTHGIELSRWCMQQGLISGPDFDWAYRPDDISIVFNFYGEAESFATMFALKWTET